MSRTGGKFKSVVFDLDGTLVDSAGDIAAALNGAFAPRGIPAFAVDDVKMMIGGGSAVLVEKAANAAGLALDASGKAELLAEFMTVYKTVSAEGRGLFPGALELLVSLKAQGVHVALCTNKPEPVTRIAVKALGIGPYLDVVIGGRDDMPKKPQPHMLEACLKPFGIAVTEAVMVGDSGADHGAARAAGTSIVMVDFGYSKVPVHALEPDAIVSHLSEIPAALARIR